MKHAFRNAILPVVTIIGLQVGLLLSGAVLTETIFNLAGVGKTVFDAIDGRDYVVIQGFTLMIAVIFMVVNLIVDISYAWLDPRVRALRAVAWRRTGQPQGRLAAVARPRRPAGTRRAPARHARQHPAPALGALGLVVLAVLRSGDLRRRHRTVRPAGQPRWSRRARGERSAASSPLRGAHPALGCPRTNRSTCWARTATSGTCSAASSTARASRWSSGPRVGVAILVGAMLGAVAGFTSGRSDNVIMRVMDVLLVFPSLILAIAIVTLWAAAC